MITREEAEKAVNSILTERFEVLPEDILFESSLNDIGLDSLDAVDLIVALEDKFGVAVDESKAMEIRTVGDIYEFIMLMAKEKHER